MALKDTDTIGWGQFANTPLANVPASYLMWVHENVKRNGATKYVLDYIKDNIDVIQKELNQSK